MALRLFAPNAPCPCGSGKKYKKCCLLKDETLRQQERVRKYIVDLDAELVYMLLDYVRDTFGEEALDTGWRIFIEDDDELDSHIDRKFFFQIFYPWFLFSFLPESEDEPWDDIPFLEGTPRTLASSFAAAFPGELSAEELEYLRKQNDAPMAFYEVLGVEKGQGIHLLNIESGEKVYVVEKNGSRTVRVGSILYTKVLEFRDMHILSALSPVPMRPMVKLHVLDILKGVREHGEYKLRDELMHHLFLEMLRAELLPPALENSDGEAIVEHRIYYEVESAHKAFKALASLAAGVKRQSMLNDAVYTRDGLVHEVEIPWLDGKKRAEGFEADELVLGTIFITGREMVVEVNSAERAAEIMRRIDKRLGSGVRHLRTEKMGVGEALDTLPGNTTENEEAGLPEDALNAVLRTVQGQYWQKWLDERIPALNMMTPRQAAGTKEGRARLEILLRDMEYSDSKLPENLRMKNYLDDIRQTLDLR